MTSFPNGSLWTRRPAFHALEQGKMVAGTRAALSPQCGWGGGAIVVAAAEIIPLDDGTSFASGPLSIALALRQPQPRPPR